MTLFGYFSRYLKRYPALVKMHRNKQKTTKHENAADIHNAVGLLLISHMVTQQQFPPAQLRKETHLRTHDVTSVFTRCSSHIPLGDIQAVWNYVAIRASSPFYRVPSEAHVSLLCMWQIRSFGKQRVWRTMGNELKAGLDALTSPVVTEIRCDGLRLHQVVMCSGDKGTLCSQEIRPKPSGCGPLSSNNRFWKIEAS